MAHLQVLNMAAAAALMLSMVSSEPPQQGGYSYLPPRTSQLVYTTTPRPTPPRTYVPPPKPTYSPSPRPTPPPYQGSTDNSGTGITRPRPTYAPSPAEHHHHHEPGMPYDFNYAVQDTSYGNDFNQWERSDGNVIKGEYRVLLPDGRTQIVRYTADWQNGYNAEVLYEGEARYPDPPARSQAQQSGGYNYRPPSRDYGAPKPGY